MGTTTLITFLLKTARTVKSVELLGSWDNFSKAYPMERDTRLGKGSWRGCHRFTDIICDGESVRPLGGKREGGLLEGGRYWYYYRLDDDVEVHDRAHPSTTNCPFLPGQQVNLLDVPIQAKHLDREHHNRSPSSDTSCALTLDPADKFLAPQPPSPEARRRLSFTRERPATRDGSRPRTAVGYDDAAHRFWPNATWLDDDSRPSTPLGAASIYSEPPIPVTGWHTSPPNRPLSTGRFGFGDYPSLSFNDSLVELGSGRSWLDLPEADNLDPAEWMSTPLAGGAVSAAEGISLRNSIMIDQPDPLRAHAVDRIVDSDSHEGPLPRRMASDASRHTSRQLSKRASSIMAEDFRVRARPSSIVESESGSVQTSLLRAASDATSQRGASSLTRSGSFACSLQHATSISSARTSGMFSSLTSGSGQHDNTRHSRLSQPLTPTISEAGDLVVDTSFDQPQLQLDSTPVRKFDSGFLGYTLPEAEMSALTIRNLETANSCTSLDTTTFAVGHRKQYVEAWNDGHEDRSTAFQELVDDLGYLGSMIA